MSERTGLTAVIRSELARRRWQLADEPTLQQGGSFENRVRQRLQEGHPGGAESLGTREIHRVITSEYCLLLHRALQSNGRIVTRAMSELFEYGRPVAQNRCGHLDLAEEALNQAVHNLWRKVDSIKEPVTLLAYFARILENEINRGLKKIGRTQKIEISDADLASSNTDDSYDTDFLSFIRSVGILPDRELDALERFQARTSLIAKLHTCLKDWKKTFTIIADFYLELSPQVIAWMLEMAAPNRSVLAENVHTYKFRALKLLRTAACQDTIAELTLLASG